MLSVIGCVTNVINETCLSQGARSVPLCVRGSGSANPSPLRPRESEQCIPDVINLEPEPVSEGEAENSEKEANEGVVVRECTICHMLKLKELTRIIHRIHLFLHLLQFGSELLNRRDFLFCTETSSTRSSCALFNFSQFRAFFGFDYFGETFSFIDNFFL